MGNAGATKIMSCVCEHEYQDERYGYKVRVFNIGKSSSLGEEYHCTVCGRTK